jgi:hypothetical protein
MITVVLMVLVFTHVNPNISLFKKYIDDTLRLFGLLEYNVKDLMIAPGVRRLVLSITTINWCKKQKK